MKTNGRDFKFHVGRRHGTGLNDDFGLPSVPSGVPTPANLPVKPPVDGVDHTFFLDFSTPEKTKKNVTKKNVFFSIGFGALTVLGDEFPASP